MFTSRKSLTSIWKLKDDSIIRKDDRVLFQNKEWRVSSRVGAGFYLKPPDNDGEGTWAPRREVKKIGGVDLGQISLFPE
jgi:hypothetical protein